MTKMVAGPAYRAPFEQSLPGALGRGQSSELSRFHLRLEECSSKGMNGGVAKQNRVRRPAAASKSWAVHHAVQQAERNAEFANLVLEQFAQRREQLEARRFGQSADVVMALDRRRLVRAAGFDDVRIDRNRFVVEQTALALSARFSASPMLKIQ